MRKTYVPLAKGEEIAGRLATLLRAFGADVYVVGSIRRKASRVGDIDLVAVSEKPASALLRGVEGLADSGVGGGAPAGTLIIPFFAGTELSCGPGH